MRTLHRFRTARSHVRTAGGVLAIGPYARRGYVSRRHLSIARITKTIYRLLGLPPLHLYDAAATDLADLFGTEADFTPHQALPPDSRIFDPAKAGDPSDPDYVKDSPTPSAAFSDRLGRAGGRLRERRGDRDACVQERGEPVASAAAP